MPYPSNFPFINSTYALQQMDKSSYYNPEPLYIVLIWTLSVIVFYIMPQPEPAPEPAPEPEPDNENDWNPVGIYRDYSTYTTHLLYQNKKTRVWRFRNRKGYVYPEKKDLALYGTRLT